MKIHISKMKSHFHLFKESQSNAISTLPPETTIPICLQSFKAGFFWNVSDRTAARPIAPLGSTTILRISKHSFMAWIISLSSTVIMSSTRSRTTGLLQSKLDKLTEGDHKTLFSVHNMITKHLFLPCEISEKCSKPVSYSIGLRQCYYPPSRFRLCCIISTFRFSS